MLRLLVLPLFALALLGGSVALDTGEADAAIHEMVAAYCSGGGVGTITEGGDLEPPGISDMSKKNFARPVLANGVVEFPLVTDHPAAKYPAGTNVTGPLGTPDHPSAEHCKALRP